MKSILFIAAVPLVATGLAFGVPAALAQPDKTIEIGDYYFGVDAGASVPVAIHLTFSPNTAGALSGSGSLSLRPAGRFGFFAGYNVSNWLALELEGFHASYSLDSFSSNLFAPSAPFILPPPTFNGDFDVWVGFANAIIKPLGQSRAGGFSPYFGVGAGMANTVMQINSLTSGSFFLGGGPVSTTSTNVAAQALTGFDYSFNKNLSIGARYSFDWIDSRTSRVFGFAGTDINLGNAMTHNFTLNATYHF